MLAAHYPERERGAFVALPPAPVEYAVVTCWIAGGKRGGRTYPQVAHSFYTGDLWTTGAAWNAVERHVPTFPQPLLIFFFH